MAQPYELLYILPGDKTEEEVQPIIQNIRELLQQHGANIVKEDFWGKRKLAYEINKSRQGFYNLVEFDLDGKALAELEKALVLHEHIMRHQVIRRVVKSPEQIAKAERLRERIAAHKQSEKEKEAVASMTPEPAATPTVKPEAEAPVSDQELDKKLEEILDTKQVDV